MGIGGEGDKVSHGKRHNFYTTKFCAKIILTKKGYLIMRKVNSPQNAQKTKIVPKNDKK